MVRLARDLVHSYQHMEADRGYAEVKRLLKKHFGDEYRIATAYIEKALSWPSIKVKDSESLQAFAVFLTGCFNTMDNVQYIEEMDSQSNIRASLKAAVMLKEKWRGTAYDQQESNGRRGRFAHLVTKPG